MCVCVSCSVVCVSALHAHSPMELALIKLNKQRTQTQFLSGCVCASTLALLVVLDSLRPHRL